MKAAGPLPPRDVSRFRLRVLAAITLVIAGLTAIGATLAQRHLVAASRQELEASIQRQIEAAESTRSHRRAIIAEICDALARNPRIRAALEDDALDLLYPSARDELSQLLGSPRAPGEDRPLQALFYRFLDKDGSVISPLPSRAAGPLDPAVESALSLPGAAASQEIGYVALPNVGGIAEIYTVPIVSSDSFEPIAALTAGFPFDAPAAKAGGDGMLSGVWIQEKLILSGLAPAARSELADAIADALARDPSARELSARASDGENRRVFFRPLNPDSRYPLAREVFVASLAPLEARQRAARLRILGIATALALLGFGVSHALSRRLARPVEALAVASASERAQRVRAEAALDERSRELARAARFSADASHQLKTPVTIMRLGLEELLNDSVLPPQQRAEVEDLIRQTGRLSSVIENLLLLSRLDAGRLALEPQPTRLRLLVEQLLDDLSILPDADALAIEVSVDPELLAQCDARYASLILQNLLENARKYNLADGRIRIVATSDGRFARLRVGNSGSPIPRDAQSHIFERFHRGAAGETVPGYGLGLNLAAELARLHGGSLALLRSADDWTEFELALPLALPPRASKEDLH